MFRSGCFSDEKEMKSIMILLDRYGVNLRLIGSVLRHGEGQNAVFVLGFKQRLFNLADVETTFARTVSFSLQEVFFPFLFFLSFSAYGNITVVIGYRNVLFFESGNLYIKEIFRFGFSYVGTHKIFRRRREERTEESVEEVVIVVMSDDVVFHSSYLLFSLFSNLVLYLLALIAIDC